MHILASKVLRKAKKELSPKSGWGIHPGEEGLECALKSQARGFWGVISVPYPTWSVTTWLFIL